MIEIVCTCRAKTTYKWKKGIVFICSGCQKEINYGEAAMSGRVKDIGYQPKPKKRR